MISATTSTMISAIAQTSAAPAAGLSRMTAYAFSFPGPEGGEIRLADYAGKVILLVNTASFCGYTNQFSGLGALDRAYGGRGLVTIGVPSNDFGQQEPGGPKEIAATAKEHGAHFTLTARSIVRGEGAHRFYRWAAQQRPQETPRWNFHKYLIGRDGQIAGVFSTQTRPDDPAFIAAIERELAKE
ncbi:MAG: glutathione peroxidase [Alphaproteobacteria bacterium]|nr:glutathione peroxidase [Alphaproteobacteria bacterium]